MSGEVLAVQAEKSMDLATGLPSLYMRGVLWMSMIWPCVAQSIMQRLHVVNFVLVVQVNEERI